MTTTLTRPEPGRTRTAPPPKGEAPVSGAAPRGHLLLAEVALFLVTAASVAGFARIFTSWSFLAPLLVVAATAHGLHAVARRRGIGLPLGAALGAVTWVLVVTWLFFLDTTWALLPTQDTWSAARFELDRSWSAFHDVVAPAPVQTGFLLAAAAAVAVGAYLADWAAFRLWSAREAVVPGITLFVFATILAEERHRILSAALVTAAMVLFVLVHRVVRLERSDAWVGRGAEGAGRRLLVAGVAVGATAVAVGVAIAPVLPGAEDEALVDIRGEGAGDNARLLTSPLVDIRSRLVDTSDTPLFSVTSPVPAYWRITGLDRFDGTQWKLSATTDQVADGRLDPAAGPPRAPNEPLTQTFTIDELQTSWLPAAFQPVAIDPIVAPLVRYDAETDTLISDDPTGRGTTYEVESYVPSLTPEMLRRAGDEVPGWVEPALELPEDFSRTAAGLAREVTARAATRYDQAMALQEWFRSDGGFTYSTDVDLGQGNDAIEEFLQQRQGYCEQFAGTYAAMARSIGLPARVAVGYTWGEQDPADPNGYRVVGRNAHAWPEVWLGRFGWVAFEPTPGRGNPDAESYTGVPADQTDEPVAEPTTTTVAPEEPGSTTTTSVLPGEQAATPPPGTSTGSDDVLRTAALGLGIAVAAAAAYLLAVPGTLAVRRRRRRARTGRSAADRTALAWTEATEALEAGGLATRPEETHTELAQRAAATWPAARVPLARLADAADAAAYGPEPPPQQVDDAWADARMVHLAVDEGLGAGARLRRLLDPRPLWAGRTRRHRIG